LGIISVIQMKLDSVADRYPLSPMQRGMLFHSISGQAPGVDIEQVFCALKEDVDPAALERAWQHVVDRHAILRTTFHWKGLAAPEQRVQREIRLELETESEIRNPKSKHLSPGQNPDFRRPIAKWAPWFEEWLEADRRREFDLGEAPLMRLTLFRVEMGEFLLVWTFHHLLLDARGIGMVLKEVFAIYEALRRDDELDLPEPRPYREFVEWLGSQETAVAERFWRERLKGVRGATAPNLEHRTSSGELRTLSAEREAWLSEELTGKLQELAESAGVTLNTILQGAWALLLSRYTAEEDIIFGAVRGGRHGNV
jgi:hypothetical protein